VLQTTTVGFWRKDLDPDEEAPLGWLLRSSKSEAEAFYYANTDCC
jgi:hypothetical protein